MAFNKGFKVIGLQAFGKQSNEQLLLIGQLAYTYGSSIQFNWIKMKPRIAFVLLSVLKPQNYFNGFGITTL